MPFHEGLTKVGEDGRLVQLLRHICRHEQEAVDAAFENHQYVATAGEKRRGDGLTNLLKAR